MGTPTSDQLALINQKALVPLTEDQVHSFTAKVIGTKRIEKLLTIVTPNFLTKMADQTKQGIALLVDHPWAKVTGLSIPYGRTYDSKIVQEGADLSLYADHYMLKGQEIDDISTDQLAAGIDGGTIFDTSAGFMTTEHLCSICNGNYFGTPDSPCCSHFRGNMYDGKECLILANDGWIFENSIVFDGGYDGAGFVKTSLSRSKTEESKQEIQLKPLALDAKSLTGDGSVFYFFSNKTGLTAYERQDGEPTVLAKIEGDDPMDPLKQAEEALALSKTALGVSNGLLEKVRTALGVTEDGGILAKITALTSQATDGAAYKTKLTEEACGAGVRALGAAFSTEIMKLSLSNLPVSEIEKVRDQYELQAKTALGGGGRHTVGAETELPAGSTTSTLSAADKEKEEKQTAAKADARSALERTGNASIMKEVK